MVSNTIIYSSYRWYALWGHNIRNSRIRDLCAEGDLVRLFYYSLRRPGAP